MARLEDVCYILDSKRIPVTASDREKGPYPYYGANGVQDYVNDYIFDDELVLLAEDGGNFGSKDKPIAYRVSGKCWVNNHAHVLKAKENMDIDYLCYSLMFYNVSDLVNGATRQKLTQADMRKIQVPLIPVLEQKEIVNKLKKVEELISCRKEQLSKLDELVKARFVEMFGDPVESRKKKKLLEIGKIFTGNTPSMKEPLYYESDDIPFIKPGDLYEGGVTKIDSVETFVSEKARTVARIVPPNAVLVTCIGTIGKIGITERESCCNQQINFIVPNDAVNSIYLAHCLTFFKSTLSSIANAPVVPIINKTQFSELEIPVFDFEQQNQFTAFVEQTDKTKAEVQKSLDELEILKKSLMQKYFG